ncbi:MAG: DUF1801 domain-containing protein [Candidatus Peribacteria bacterium]|nr:MAG: DUF1801 domain-containing protein [Candidatus Peribacteria bacterium]
METIDSYIEQFPPETQAILQKVRQLVHQLIPDATETFKYQIPTFQVQKKNFVHMAGYQHHIGFYPTPTVISAFIEQLEHYKHAKGSVQFPLSQDIPYKLIQDMLLYRLYMFSHS